MHRSTDRVWLAALVAGALTFAGCGSPAETIAGVDVAATCAELEEANTPLARRVVESDLLDAVEDADDEDLLDVIGALKEQCPEQAAELLGTGEVEPEHLDVTVELDQCAKRDTRGTVTNESDQTVHVTLEIQFFDDDDVLLDTTSTSVRSLGAGSTGRWDTSYLGDDRPHRCRVRLEQVRPQ